MTLDVTDRQIIAATQAGLPLVAEPYKAIAEDLGMEEAELCIRLKALQASGIVRRIAVAPNHYKLGMTANGMSVWDVDDARITELGRQVGALDYVSHCYERPRSLPDWPYNLFTMVHSRSLDACEETIAAIAEGEG